MIVGLAGVLALALGGLAGCADEAPPAVATAGTGGPPAATTSTAATGEVARYLDATRRYVDCLRGKGFEVPDPDARGHVDLGALGDPRRLKRDPKWMDASRTCGELLVEVPAELEEQGPAMTAEQIAHAREYARCMRANGVPDFADPGADGRFDLAGRGALTERQVEADVRANQICGPVLDGRPSSTPDPTAKARG